MFKKLVNESTLRFILKADGPVLINDGAGSKIDPALTDMSFVRCRRGNSYTVYIPGSSIKGVFRTRYEQLMRAIEMPVGDKCMNGMRCFDHDNNHEKEIDDLFESSKGSILYAESCSVCRLFGNLSLAGRVRFSDAYPISDEQPEFGMRHGVGISRITGAAHPGALFDLEILEKGLFEVHIRLTNFGLYQLRLLLWIIQDINDGMVTFGMGGSRGNGQMRIHEIEKIHLLYRFYIKGNSISKIRGYFSNDTGENMTFHPTVYGCDKELVGMTEILTSIGINNSDDLRTAMQREPWKMK